MQTSSQRGTTVTYSAANPIRVLVVDDSVLICRLLTTLLNELPDMEVVGVANDPLEARTKIKELNPDVLTLDVEMPKMDGITFLSNLMRLRPMPVVMVSTLTERGSEVTLRALALGAVGFVPKPTVDVQNAMEDRLGDLAWEIRRAAAHGDDIRNASKLQKQGDVRPKALASSDSATKKISGGPSSHLIAIGASTGGTEAIMDVLKHVPPGSPGIVISQHIPPGFSASFARRVDAATAVHFKEATDGELIRDGHAYLAPGDRHLKIVADSQGFRCVLDDGPRVSLHKPSVDVMFQSLADARARNTLGIILTGMGRDGATGLKSLRGTGAYTIAQDKDSSVVYGMPRAAVDEGGVAKQLSLDNIGRYVAQHAEKTSSFKTQSEGMESLRQRVSDSS